MHNLENMCCHELAQYSKFAKWSSRKNTGLQHYDCLHSIMDVNYTKKVNFVQVKLTVETNYFSFFG